MKRASCMLGWSTKIGWICFQNKNIKKNTITGQGKANKSKLSCCFTCGSESLSHAFSWPHPQLSSINGSSMFASAETFLKSHRRAACFSERLTDLTLLCKDEGLGTNAHRTTCLWCSYDTTKWYNKPELKIKTDQQQNKTISFTIHWHLTWAHNAQYAHFSPIPTHTHTHAHTYTHTHGHTYTWTHTHAHTHTHMDTYTRTHTHTHMDTHIWTHIHTHMETHTHTHTNKQHTPSSLPLHDVRKRFRCRVWSAAALKLVFDRAAEADKRVAEGLLLQDRLHQDLSTHIRIDFTRIYQHTSG